MYKKFSGGRRRAVRAASYLAAAFLILGGFTIRGYSETARYRWLLQTQYQHSFAELTTAVSELDSALQKGVFATSPCLLSTLLTQIYGKAMTAQLALGGMPYSFVELEQTASFVAKTGDYALSLSRSSTFNEGLNEGELKGLSDLAALSASLSQTLQNLQSEIYGGSLNMEDVIAAQLRLSQEKESGEKAVAGQSFQDMESEFPELPSLIYDGPFSEHLTGRSPLALEGLPYVDESAAAAAAGEFLGIPPENFTLLSGGEGAMPTWGLSAQRGEGEVYVEVSQIGGKVVTIFTSYPAGDAQISSEEAVGVAAEFLVNHGYHDMADTYWIVEDNKITVNFCSTMDDVLIYPDLIHVTVALDSGDIVGFNANGYLTNHTQRELPLGIVTPEIARDKVAGSLTVLSSRMALIPSEGEHEVLCVEFKCQTQDDRHIIVYVNTLHGEEEKILLLLEDESGTLVI